MKVLINRKPVQGPWGGGNLFVSSFCNLLLSKGHEVTHSLDKDIDIIFMQDPRYSDLGISINEIAAYKNQRPEVKVFHRVNECDARKGTSGMDSMLRSCSAITDHTIFVSNWMKDYHLSRGWQCNSHSVVYNGVDLDHFKKRSKIKNNKRNIVTHHWADNPYKGSDVYDFIDQWVADQKDFTFTYIGRYAKGFSNSKLISPLHGEALGKELSRYDIYVSGSRFDPGPNHIIESIACGIPTIVHADGGGALEFAGKENSFRTGEELVALLNRVTNSNEVSHDLRPHSWEECIDKVLEQIETL